MKESQQLLSLIFDLLSEAAMEAHNCSPGGGVDMSILTQKGGQQTVSVVYLCRRTEY